MSEILLIYLYFVILSYSLVMWLLIEVGGVDIELMTYMMCAAFIFAIVPIGNMIVSFMILGSICKKLLQTFASNYSR